MFATPMYSTRSGFLLLHIEILPRTLTTTDATPCTASASYVHALSLPQGPIYPPLGRTFSTLTNTKGAGDAHNA